MTTRKITLVPIAQRRPTADFVSAPSKNRKPITVTQDEFDAKYANSAHTRLVSFDADGVSNPQVTPACGRLVIYIKQLNGQMGTQ